MPRRKTRDLTPEEIVTDMHPYNEWSGAHTRAAVSEIGELVRYLNHATQHPEALPDPEAIGEKMWHLSPLNPADGQISMK